MLIYLLILLPLLTAGLTLFNLVTWPRGRRAGHVEPAKVSVLIPARDEAGNIEACLQSVLRNPEHVFEIIVCDDGSTDGTGEILARMASVQPRLKILRGASLPEGWVGKTHACHQLASAARGDHLLFLDADTRVEPTGVAQLLRIRQHLGADVVTAMPRQTMRGFAERLMLPLLHLTYTSWFPLVLTHRSRDVRFLAANGQVLLVRRPVYDAIGGYAAVRDAVVDDMAFCRRAKTHGHRVVFADGFEIARCRMYGDFAGIWAGFSKNLYPGIGAHPIGLAVVLVLYAAAFVLPWLALAAGLAGQPDLLIPGMIGVLANVGSRVALIVRLDHPWLGLVLHPLSVLIFMAIAVNSWRWTARGAVRWRGRTYDPSRAQAPAARGAR